METRKILSLAPLSYTATGGSVVFLKELRVMMSAIGDDEEESVVSELIKESIEEMEEENSEYSLEFDDEGWRDGSTDSQQQQQQTRQTQHQQQQSALQPAVKAAAGGVEQVHGHQQRDDSHVVPGGLDSQRLGGAGAFPDMEQPIETPPAASIGLSASHSLPPWRVEKKPVVCATEESSKVGDTEEAQKHGAFPVQVLALKARLDGILEGVGREGLSATEALSLVTREHAALRECLGVVEQELLAARHNVARDAATRLRVVHEKRARADARRVRHFEQLGEAQRAAAVARAEANVLQVRLEDTETAHRHTKEMLGASRSSRLDAEERAQEWRGEAETAKKEVEELRKEIADVSSELEQERDRSAGAARDADDKLELCERKRQLEVAAAEQAAEAREKAVETQLNRLPEHQQQLVQAELDRVARWEGRLEAEAASLQRKEEAHKMEVEACRAQASRMEAELRTRLGESVESERARLREARSSFEGERGQMLQRVARAEAVGQAKAAEAASLEVEALEASRRVEAEKLALDTRATLLAPQFRALDEERASLERERRDARDEARRATDEARRAREMEVGLVEREAAVEVKWEETAVARRAVKQAKRRAAEEADVLSEQRKAVAVARVRLHEQQMELALQMSQTRKALDLMKRVYGAGGDRGARRLASELATLALDRGENTAHRVGTNVVESDYAHVEERTLACTPTTTSAGVAVPISWQHVQGETLPLAPTTEDIGVPSSQRPWATAERPIPGVFLQGNGYADDAGARETLKKVRAVVAGGGKSVRVGIGDTAATDGQRWEGVSVQGWAGRLRAAAIAAGALPN